MYHTPLGDRVLRPAEAQLFAESLRTLGDYLSDMELTMGAGVFDDLQRNQQIAVLHAVGRALLCPAEPAPVLTAAVEAGVWCVYQNVRDMIEVELDDAAGLMPGETWRQLILAACREAGVGGDLPAEDCRDKLEWDYPVDCLEARVLWDYDWQLEDSIDLSPDASRRLKDELGIADDYFVAVPPDPPDAEAERLLEAMNELADAVRLASPGEGCE
ncbi:MAG: hypothetical protein GX575_22275 [Candidatus Anammoximicrobium sp.]|nr:hypothetical protein [Candidatus Anammoximicrobium sp.]